MSHFLRTQWLSGRDELRGTALCILLLLIPMLGAPTCFAFAGDEPIDHKLSHGTSASPDHVHSPGPVESLERVLRVKPSNPAEKTVLLRIWKNPSPRNNLDMSLVPWAVLGLLQQGSSSPVVFGAASMEPPSLVVWSWREFASGFYMSDHMQHVGLSRLGEGAILRWGLPWEDGSERRSTCYWWPEMENGRNLRDFLLVDEVQLDRLIGCIAAGLLRHVANPLSEHVERHYGGQPDAEALPEVKRLFECSLQSQFAFVNAKSPAASPANREEIQEFLIELERRVRHDCLPDRY